VGAPKGGGGGADDFSVVEEGEPLDFGQVRFGGSAEGLSDLQAGELHLPMQDDVADPLPEQLLGVERGEVADADPDPVVVCFEEGNRVFPASGGDRHDDEVRLLGGSQNRLEGDILGHDV
jgi:hypothetical protein